MKQRDLYREFFLHTDIWIMAAIFAALGGLIISLGTAWHSILFFAGGLILFVFSEYLTHRFLFHLKPPENRYLLQFLKRLHYDHHKHPNDLKLLFLPVWYSIPNFLVLAGICYLITRDTAGTAAFGMGLILMLLAYEWKHYVAHRPIRPRSAFGKWMKKTHQLHHFKNENYWYGVSNPIGDILFGTLKDEKKVEMSQTAKDLEKRG
ncbi:sterol desaturase family protein [Metabacillus sp. 84]|uniref:sterol desaturase family protein n=1 Tax=unclassified Metabacillus TaxID=2675274 RepID=UPI003CEDF63D